MNKEQRDELRARVGSETYADGCTYYGIRPSETHALLDTIDAMEQKIADLRTALDNCTSGHTDCVRDLEAMEKERDEADEALCEIASEALVDQLLHLDKTLSTMPAREAARLALPLDGADAQALEGALSLTESELRATLNALDAMEEERDEGVEAAGRWGAATQRLTAERDEARAELHRVRIEWVSPAQAEDWRKQWEGARRERDEARAAREVAEGAWDTAQRRACEAIARGVRLWEYAASLVDEDWQWAQKRIAEAEKERDEARSFCERWRDKLRGAGALFDYDLPWDTNDNDIIDADELAAFAEAADHSTPLGTRPPHSPRCGTYARGCVAQLNPICGLCTDTLRLPNGGGCYACLDRLDEESTALRARLDASHAELERISTEVASLIGSGITIRRAAEILGVSYQEARRRAPAGSEGE